MPSRPSITDTGEQKTQPTLFNMSVEIWRYLLIIPPSARTIQDVALVKRRIAEEIGPFKNEHAIAHITLLYNYLPVVHERAMCDAIRGGVAGLPAFPLALSGPEYFPDQRSIHLSVVDRQPLMRLRKSVMTHLRSYPRLSGLAGHTTTANRLSIASYLRPEQFGPALAVARSLPPQAPEWITHLWLLRGAQDKGTPYVEVESFPLAT